MAQDITWLGASYSDVPAIQLPKTGGGQALFADPTVVTAVASDVATGKYFIDSNGDLVAGTGTGGGGTGAIVDVVETLPNGADHHIITGVDISDTTAVASDVAQGKYFYDATGTKTAGTASGGGGGLVFEEGTFEPTEDIVRPEILFANSHQTIPIFIMMSDATGDYDPTTYSNLVFYYMDMGVAFGEPYYQATTSATYVVAYNRYRASAATSTTASGNFLSYPSSTPTDANSSYPRYYVKEDRFYPFVSDSSYWRSGRTYKWIAVWAPTA